MKRTAHNSPEGAPSAGVGIPDTSMTSARQRITALLLAVVLALGMAVYLPGPLTVSAAVEQHNIGTDGSLTITANDNGKDYLVTGSTSSNTIKVESGYTGNITLQDVKIEHSGFNDVTAFEIASGANVTLTLEGDNTLKSGGERAGLQAPAGATLEITGTGKLEATGSDYGAGIGGGYDQDGGAITITGDAEVIARGYVGGAGIGGGGGKRGDGGGGGTIVITGNATVTATGHIGSAGIGGGGGERGGGGGNITIDTTGQVTARGGNGDADESVYTAGGGAGIGGGSGSSALGVIQIAHHTEIDATGGSQFSYYGSGAAVGMGGNSGNTHGGKMPHITTPRALPTATAGVAYDETIRAYVDGNNAAFTLTATEPGEEIPPGLGITAGSGADYAVGTFTGTPTTPGAYTFTVTAEHGGNSHGRQFTLMIVPSQKELGDYIITSNSVDLTDTANIALAGGIVTIKAPGDYRFAMKPGGNDPAKQGIKVADNVTDKVELTLAEIRMDKWVDIGSGAVVDLTLTGDNEIKTETTAWMAKFFLKSNAQVTVDGGGTLNCENINGTTGIDIDSGARLALAGGELTASSGSGTGISVASGGSIEISGGELTADGVAYDLYLQGNSRLTMDGPGEGGTLRLMEKGADLDGTTTVDLQNGKLIDASGSMVPAITSASPVNGSVAGGDTVVLTGQNFWPGTGVKLDGVALPGTEFTVDNTTRITLTTPPHAPGSVDIQLTHPVVQGIQASQNGYTYTEIGAPQIAVQGGGGTEIPFGGSLTLEVTNADDFSSPQYQWYRDDAAILGATSDTYIADEAGRYKVKVTDGLEEKESAAITLTLQGDPSTLTLQPIGNQTVEEEQYIEIEIDADYSGSQPVTLGYSVSNLPLGLSVDQAGLISGAPQADTAGDYDVQVEVTAGALRETTDFRLTVREKGAGPGPGDPTLQLDPIADATAMVNEPFTMTLGYSYSGSGTLSWSADSLPPGLNIGSGGVISGTPRREGPFAVTIDVTDGTLHDSGGFLLTVEKEGGGEPGPGPDPDPTYILSVRANAGGSVSTTGGQYKAGDRISIRAIPDAGYTFAGWSADNGDLEDKTSAETVFIMPAGSATVIASFTKESSGTDPGPDPGGNGNNGGGSTGGSSGSGDSYSGGSSIPDSRMAKTQLPASAFSWDSDRTLTIDHERITPLGLLSVQWDNVHLTRGTDFAVYSGSVIIRFGEEFMARQSPGEHTVKVEFLNHTGEATVTVGQAAATEEAPAHPDNDTHNPSTGGYPDGSYSGANDNPNTGDGRGIWPTLLLGSLGGIVLVVRRLKPVA